MESLINTISRMGVPDAIDPILQSLYMFPRNGIPDIYKRALSALVPTSTLTEEIVDLMVGASTYQHLYKGREHDPGYISLDISDKAITNLCFIKTSVTNNALHLVLQKKDISVTMDPGCYEPWQEQVSFSHQRDIARSELKSRGDPPYQPKAYFKNLG
jgi:hypothetical protein